MISRLTAPRYFISVGDIRESRLSYVSPGRWTFVYSRSVACRRRLYHFSQALVEHMHTLPQSHVSRACGAAAPARPSRTVRPYRTTAYRESQTHRDPRERRHTKLRQHARAYQSTLTSFCPPSPPRRRPLRARHDVPARPHVVRSVRPQLDVCSRVKEKTRRLVSSWRTVS